MGGIRRGGSRGRDKDGFHSDSDHHNALLYLSGVGSLRKQGGEPGILSDSLLGGNRLCTPKRTGHTPVKMQIDDEISRDVIARHTSPGIVGRLMGLDIMPSFEVDSQITCSGNHLRNKAPGSSSDKYASSGDVPCRRSIDEIPEFKDVFEVTETTRMTNRSPKTKTSNTCSGLDKVYSADLSFVRQKFMYARRLSSGESFQRSKEFYDALEALVSNKDLLMEILQESNNVAMSDQSDLSCSPSSGVNRITLLKPSRRSKFIDVNVVYTPEEDTERCFHSPKEAKHYTNFSSQPPKEDTGPFRQKLSRSSYRESIDKIVSPTRIVVLKPCLEKTQNMEGAFPLTHDMFCSSYRRTKPCLDDGIQRPCPEESIHHMSPGDCDVLGHRGKGSREIAHEVTTQMRRTVKCGLSEKQILNPDIGIFNQHEQLPLLSSMAKAKLKSSEAFQSPSGPRDAPDAPCFGSSPTYSTKRSIRKEARRRLSDRWKMTHQYQHPSQDANTFSTLGDMLALSDKEASKLTSGAAACSKCPIGELHRDVMPGSCDYPLGISSNDGWKDNNVSSLIRLKPISSSCMNQGSHKLSSGEASCRHSEFSMLENIIRAGHYSSEDVHHGRPRRSLIRSSTYHCDESDVPSPDEAESVVTEHEIHENFEKPTYNFAIPEFSEARGLVHPANSNDNLGDECYLDISSAVPEWQDEVQASAAQNKVMNQEQISIMEDHLIIAPSLSDSASQAEGNGHNHCQDNEAKYNPLTELVSHLSSNEDDQPSPVSILESSLDAEDGYSGGFEKISADLQELRMQLRLLKMEATGTADDTEPVLLSDGETAASCGPLDEIGLISCSFWDEDERDFCYVIDMLTCLGIRSAEQDLLLDACYLSGLPVGSDVYDVLEKKYNMLILWPQSERRLLFDLINDVLVDIITCLTHCGSQGLAKKCQLKWDKERLVEEVWERLGQQRREAECFQEEKMMGAGWLDCEDATCQIAGEIGSMLAEDLLEEIIADLLL